MLTWKIPVVYKMCGQIEVEANTIAEAMDIARDADGVLPLPDDASYVEGSWELGEESDYDVRALYNDNLPDIPQGKLKTPRGEFTISACFSTGAEANAEGYGIAFTHEEYDLYTKACDPVNRPHSKHFALVPRGR